MEVFVKQINYTDESEKTFRRINGWSWPLHPFQIISWFVILYLTLYFYLTCIPSLVKRLQLVNYVIFSIILIVNIIFQIVVVSVDPADENVAFKFKSKSARPSVFDKNLHRNVIENFWCNICEVEVSPGSKHCGACNKCIAKFDHHCKWLNNCIGSQNYRSFIWTLISTILACLWMVAFLCLECVSYFTDRTEGTYLKPYLMQIEEIKLNSSCFNGTSFNRTYGVCLPVFKVFYVESSGGAWMATVVLSVVLCLVAASSIIHLLGFHVFLTCRRMTTYDYIARRRIEREAKEQQIPSISSQTSLDLSKFFHNFKNNRITPVDDDSRIISRDMWIDFESFVISTNNLFFSKVPKVVNS